MSRVVRGLGPAPDGRGINTPKEIRKYEKASRLFRRAEKAFNTIKKLRKRKKQQKGTPKADRIQQRINRLKERKDKLLAMYNDLGDRMSIQPASSVDHYHNAFEGGYVDHVLRVIKCAKHVYKLWEDLGADMSGYTKDE